MTTPLLLDVRRASTTDGPGLRTCVFFKGCNLDCAWCHNPESKASAPELAYFAELCIACGACRDVCTRPQACMASGACAEVCPTGARRIYGAKWDADRLVRTVLADQPYYEATGGGVTFSGGECLLCPDTVAELAARCKKHGIHVAVDTAGYVAWEAFEKVLPYVDLFLYDVKALDPLLHRRGTGADNALILSNLDRLIATGAHIVIRTPVIPGFNEGEEVARIAAYCADRGLTHELLPYHAFGTSKSDALRAARKPLEP